MSDGLRRWWKSWWPALAGCAVAALFVVFMIFLAVRDDRAVDRCTALGGETWDSGQHCVIGDYRVVDTHDRTWG